MTGVPADATARRCAHVAGFLEALDAVTAGHPRLPHRDVGDGRVIPAADRVTALDLARQFDLRPANSAHAYHLELVDSHGHTLTVQSRVPAAHVALALAEVLLTSPRSVAWDNSHRLARAVFDRFEQSDFGACPVASTPTSETLAALLGDHLADATYFPGDWALAPAFRALRASDRVATACALAGTRPDDFASAAAEPLTVPARPDRGASSSIVRGR